MPIIIKNGKTYGDRSVTLSQAEYNALSEVEKNNGTCYYIYDVNGVVTADDVALDGGTVETLAGSVATFESSPATATHEVGDHILWNGQLYTVTAAIAVGETLTVGTNITSTNVGSELTALNAGLSDMTAIVTGKLSTSSGFTSYFSYPTGFTYLNCTVTNVALAYSVDGVSVWRTGLGLQAAGSPARLFVDNSTNGIRVFNDNSALYGADFKVLLVKN